MPLDYLSELKESCAIAKSRSLTVTRATKITEWKSALRDLLQGAGGGGGSHLRVFVRSCAVSALSSGFE